MQSLLASRDWGQAGDLDQRKGEVEELDKRRGEVEELLRSELERIVGGQEVRQKGDYPFIASLKVKVGSSSGARK